MVKFNKKYVVLTVWNNIRWSVHPTSHFRHFFYFILELCSFLSFKQLGKEVVADSF